MSGTRAVKIIPYSFTSSRSTLGQIRETDLGLFLGFLVGLPVVSVECQDSKTCIAKIQIGPLLASYSTSVFTVDRVKCDLLL